jgi:lipid-A-disaccharide synthase
MSDPATIYVTANSPGEITGFLVPVVAEIRRHFAAARVVVILLPCTFATGREEEVARSVPGVDEVLPARRIWPLVFKGLPYPATALVHLGGDLFYAALLARRWGIPTWGFQWAQRKWDRYMKGYFVKTEADARRLEGQGIGAERIHVIGDLVVDSVRMILHGSPSLAPRVPAAPHVVFLPGSRREEVVLLSRFFLEVSEHLASVMPGSRFSLLLSPFIDWGRIRPALEGPVDRKVGGLRARLVRDDRGGWSMVSPAGTRLEVVREGTLPVMASSDFVVSIPGTKTGEAGSLGKPMLILLPLNRMEVIPWHGLLGLLDWLPLVGRTVKYLIYTTMIDRYIGRVYSQPNLMAERPIVPEMVGYLTPMLVSDKILEIFGRRPVGRAPLPLRGRVESALGPYSVNGAAESDYGRMQADLLALYSPFSGAAERAVSVVADALQPA